MRKPIVPRLPISPLYLREVGFGFATWSEPMRSKIYIISYGSVHQADQRLSISAEKRALRFITRISRTFRRFWLT